MAVLIGMSGDFKGKNFPIDRDEFTIGRSADNAIPLNHPTVSGHHCKIIRDGERYILNDLGSTNGTRVNAKEAREVVLKPKDLVQVGSVEFLFNSESMTAEDAQAAFTDTEVVVSQGPTAAPESFNSISPFGARQRENQGMWGILIAVVGAVALAVVAYFFYKLFTAH